MGSDDVDYEMIARFLSNESTSRERLAIKEKIEKDPKFAEILTAYKRIWNHQIPVNDWKSDEKWNSLLNRIEREHPIDKWRQVRKERKNARPRDKTFALSKLLKFAAVFVLATLTALLILEYKDEYTVIEEEAVKEIVIDRGQKGELRLSDGTRVYLNSESTISHPVEFHSDKRVVSISGEAYFEVARDERPFFVYVNGALIEILGTRFNVSSYSEMDEIQVVVAGGEVSVGFEDQYEYDRA